MLSAEEPIARLRHEGPPKMISAITSAAHESLKLASASQAQPAANSAAQSLPKAQPQSTAQPVTDTVQISTAAQAALRETLETPAQTAKEASSGDRQAQRLLAKEAAASKV